MVCFTIEVSTTLYNCQLVSRKNAKYQFFKQEKEMDLKNFFFRFAIFSVKSHKFSNYVLTLISSIIFFRRFRSCCKRDIRKRKISARETRFCSFKRVSGNLKRLAKTVCLKLGSAEGLTSLTSL